LSNETQDASFLIFSCSSGAGGVDGDKEDVIIYKVHSVSNRIFCPREKNVISETAFSAWLRLESYR